jgi:4-hydroxy-3-polyprenylbenzoate decarboxylase
LRTVVVITGASGSVFGVRLLERLPGEKLAVLTKWGKVVLHEETGVSPRQLEGLCDRVFADDDLSSPLASGSNPFDAVVVMPASANFLAKVAAGIGDTLGTRVCHIALKERRRLVLALRESPLNGIALENALRISRDGGVIMPLSPFFYMKPDSLETLIAQFVDRVIAVTSGESPAEGWRREEIA